VRLGRNPLNDLVLEHPAVSQFHAEIDFDERETRFTDLGTTNGTVRSGEALPCDEAVLVDKRAALEIGPLWLTVDRNAAAAKPAPARGQTFLAKLHTKPPSRSANTVVRRGATVLAPPRPSTPPVRAASGSQPPAPPSAPSPGSRAAAAATVLAPPPPQAYTADPTRSSVRPSPATAPDGLTLLYQRYREAWSSLEQALEAQLECLPPMAHDATIAGWAQRYPQLAQEPRFQALAAAAQVPVSAATTSSDWMALLAQAASYFGLPAPTDAAGAEELLVRAVRALEAFGDAYVALRVSHEGFRAELTRERAHGRSAAPFAAARDGRALLAHLLDPRADGDAGLEELRRAFADLMTLQTTLLSTMLRGARALLGRLGPAAIDSELSRTGGPGGLFGWWRPLRESALWRRYTLRHRELSKDRALEELVLGPGLARAFAAFTGERREQSPRSR
jgi:hypothetical protein